MEFVDRSLGDGDDPDAREHHLLEEGRDVLLVAADPVDALRDHHIHPAGADGFEQILVAGPQMRGAGEPHVGKALRFVPAVRRDQAPADPKLVLNRPSLVAYRRPLRPALKESQAATYRAGLSARRRALRTHKMDLTLRCGALAVGRSGELALLATVTASRPTLPR